MVILLANLCGRPLQTFANLRQAPIAEGLQCLYLLPRRIFVGQFSRGVQWVSMKQAKFLRGGSADSKWGAGCIIAVPRGEARALLRRSCDLLNSLVQQLIYCMCCLAFLMDSKMIKLYRMTWWLRSNMHSLQSQRHKDLCTAFWLDYPDLTLHVLMHSDWPFDRAFCSNFFLFLPCHEWYWWVGEQNTYLKFWGVAAGHCV